jgi:hypothetical protein
VSGLIAVMPKDLAMHRVVVVAVPAVTAFDLAIPELMFGAAEQDRAAAYSVAVCTAVPGGTGFGSRESLRQHF